MEESGEYRVTRSKGRGPGRKIRKVIFRHLDEAPARRFYERTRPRPGYGRAPDTSSRCGDRTAP